MGVQDVPNTKVQEEAFHWKRPDGTSVEFKFVDFFLYFHRITRPALLGGFFNFHDEVNAQILVTNLNAQWLLWFYSECQFEEHIQRFASNLRPVGNPHWHLTADTQERIFFSGVFPHSLRQSYVSPPRMERFNAVAERILQPLGFRTLDAYNTSKLVGNLSHDGLHLNGPAATALARILLAMFCEES